MASIYDKASLVLIPSGTKTSKVYSQKPTNGDGDFTFSRSTAATRVNASGNIEKETQNLLLHSNSFDDAIWSHGSITLTGGQAGYDGSNNAWELNKAAAAYVALFQAISNSNVVTGTFYVKAGTLTTAALYSSTFTTPNAFAHFDLTNGNLLSSAGIVDASSEDVGNGWWRLSMVVSKGISNFRIYPDWSGSTAGTIYVQDAQLEQGLVARDYIETTTTAIYGGITDNVPRLDYTDSSCPALLLEPQRTNLMVQSEGFSTSTWMGNSFGVSATENAAISPEGLQNATELEFTTTPAEIYDQFTNVASSMHIGTMFLKNNGVNFVQLEMIGNTPAILAQVTIDLRDGTLSAQVGDYTPTIEDYGNGWWRVALGDTGNASVATPAYKIKSAGYTGSFYVYGAQLEAGSYATSYIPTYGSAVTRNEDAMNVVGATDIIGQTEGTIFVEVDAVDFSTDQRIGIGDGTSANRIVIRFASGSVIQLSAVIGSTTQASISGSGSVGNAYKIAGVYKENDFALWINGIEVATDTSGTISGTFSRIANDNGFSTQKFANPIKQFLLFPTRLSNEELATLTTI